MHRFSASLEQYMDHRREKEIPVWWFSGDRGMTGLCFSVTYGVQLILTDETLAGLGYTRNDPSGLGASEETDPRDFLFK